MLVGCTPWINRPNYGLYPSTVGRNSLLEIIFIVL
jgi:hypothetical protein